MLSSHTCAAIHAASVALEILDRLQESRNWLRAGTQRHLKV